MKPLKFQIKDGIATHVFEHGVHDFVFVISEFLKTYNLYLHIGRTDKDDDLIQVNFGEYNHIDFARLAAWIIKQFILSQDVTSIINTIHGTEIIKNVKGRR